MHSPFLQIWEENGGVSYSLNVAYLAHLGRGEGSGVGFFPYFPPLKPRCVLWSDKYGTYRGILIRLSDDFSKETLQARKDWQEIFSDEKQGLTAKTAVPSKAII